MVKPQTQQILEQLESEPLKELLSQLLDGQEQIQEKLKQIDVIQEKLKQIDVIQEQQQQMQEKLQQIDKIQEKLSDIEAEVKAWGGWLRTSSSAVLFVVSISFIGAFFGLLLPIAINLWKSTI
ncbi:MAG: hypothetical protein ACRDEA_18980 [Microcystaceae cyanobacterium]